MLCLSLLCSVDRNDCFEQLDSCQVEQTARQLAGRSAIKTVCLLYGAAIPIPQMDANEAVDVRMASSVHCSAAAAQTGRPGIPGHPQLTALCASPLSPGPGLVSRETSHNNTVRRHNPSTTTRTRTHTHTRVDTAHQALTHTEAQAVSTRL